MTGERLGGWVLGAVLGEGAEGTVYAARHVELRREAAVKVLRPALARDRGRVERFFDEARAASSIRHPGVVEIYDCGRDAGHIYIAMERLVGETLYTRLRRAPLALGESLTIVRQIAEALAAAHDLGIVHRDIKPENVFLHEHAGRVTVKLVDFGIAKLAADRRASATLTGAGLYGSPPYMAPEQCNGAPVDQRADLYALGCLLHELLTGTPPFGFDHPGELVEAHRNHSPPSLADGCPEAPPALDELAERLLEKDPQARPASAREVVDLLQQIALATPIEASRPESDAPLAPTVLEPIHGWQARVWRGLIHAPPWVAAGACCLLGAVMLGIAIVEGVGDSYGASNWGFTFIVLVPLIVSFLLKTMARADAAIRELGARGMLRGRAGFDPSSIVAAASRRLGAGIVGFGAVVAVTSIAISIAEWHHRWTSLRIPGTWWSESAVMGVFGACCQGCLISVVLVFVVYCIGWAHLIHQLTTPRSEIKLAIDRGSQDPRQGFEVFEEPMALALVTGALVQLTIYFSNVEHFAEVRHESLFTTLVPRDWRALFDTGTGSYPSTTTLLASLLVVSFLGAAGLLLHRAINESEGGRPHWPLAIGPLWLAGALVMTSVATVFYRLGPVVPVVFISALARVRRRGGAELGGELDRSGRAR